MDREKVIKGLEICTKEIPMSNAVHKSDFCKECPYYNAKNRYCWNQIAMMRDALDLLKEQEERKGNYVTCKVKTPTGKWNGEKCSVCGTEYIGSAPHQWKFCPDCGAKMEGR